MIIAKHVHVSKCSWEHTVVVVYEWCGLSACRRKPTEPTACQWGSSLLPASWGEVGLFSSGFVFFPILEWVCNVLTLVKQERNKALNLRKEDKSSRYACVSEKDLRATLMCEELGGRRNKILFLFLLFQEALCVLFPFHKTWEIWTGLFWHYIWVWHCTLASHLNHVVYTFMRTMNAKAKLDYTCSIN